MLRKKQYFVLYPEYFDKSLKRKEGRKVPKNKAVEESSLAKLTFACKHLSLEHIVEKEKKYSKSWWKSEGRILIVSSGVQSKTELIRRVANISRKIKKVEKPEEKKKEKKKDKKGKR